MRDKRQENLQDYLQKTFAPAALVRRKLEIMTNKTMTVTATRAALKEKVAATFVRDMGDHNYPCIQVEDYEYVVPFETEDHGVQYVKFTVSACDTNGSKIRAPFTVEGAIEKWENRKQEVADKKAATAAIRAAAKAEREAAKANKA